MVSRLHTYYKEYIDDIQYEIDKSKRSLETAEIMLEDSKSYIMDNLTSINKLLGYDITTVEEFIHNKHNEKNYLYDKILKLYKEDNNSYKKHLIVLIRFFSSIKNIHIYNNKLRVLESRSIMSYKEYRTYVKLYYTQVHKEVLEGNAYKYSNNIGTFFINRATRKGNKQFNKYIDYKKTRENKERLMKEGKILYNHKDALEYAKKGLDYNGVNYIEYLNNDVFYQFVLTNSKVKYITFTKFEHSEYVNTKYNTLYIDELKLLAKTKEEVYNLDMNLRYKLNILLKIDPTIYVKYIRTDEQTAYNNRKINRKN